jgi:hypothetical protein
VTSRPRSRTGARAGGDPDHLRAFTGVIAKLFAEGGANAISPWPFMVSDGRILSIIEVS